MAFRKRKYLLERGYEALQRDCCMTLIPISTHSQRVRLRTFDVLIPCLGVHTSPGLTKLRLTRMTTPTHIFAKLDILKNSPDTLDGVVEI